MVKEALLVTGALLTAKARLTSIDVLFSAFGLSKDRPGVSLALGKGALRNSWYKCWVRVLFAG